MVRLEPTREQLKTVSYIDVARQAAAWAPNIWRTMEPIVVWVEEPRGRSQRAIHQLSVMAGALLSGLPREIPVEMVTAGESRKMVGIPGNASKHAVMSWATVESDADFSYDEHDADAYLIARAILAHGSRETIESEG